MYQIRDLILLKQNNENIQLHLKNNSLYNDFEKINISYELQSGDYIEYFEKKHR